MPSEDELKVFFGQWLKDNYGINAERINGWPVIKFAMAAIAHYGCGKQEASDGAS
jgi:hypothetical protein